MMDLRACVTALLSARTTVRITYQRGTGRYRVDVVRGDVRQQMICIGVGDEATAERLAAGAAARRGLDVSRLDVP